jgi:hypothetical protein
MHNPLAHALLGQVRSTVIVPAGEPQLLKLQVDSIGLVTTSALAMTEEEVGL